MTNPEIIIVGTGPAAVSFAVPFANRGYNILFLEKGEYSFFSPPSQPFSEWSRDVKDANDIFTQTRLEKLQKGLSPKFNTPMSDALDTSHTINTINFDLASVTAVGGASNLWGAGVAALDYDEIDNCFPCAPNEMISAFERVARRIGVSGGCDDNLKSYFGLDNWSEGRLEIDERCLKALEKYENKTSSSSKFKLGYSRLAVLAKDRVNSKRCSYLNNCLFGCINKSIYNAADEISLLKQKANVSVRYSCEVQNITQTKKGVKVTYKSGGKLGYITGDRIGVAAGTISSTKLGLQLSRFSGKLPLLHAPSAAFLLLSSSIKNSFEKEVTGLSQLSFWAKNDSGCEAYGNIFSLKGMPYFYFYPYLSSFSSRLAKKILPPLWPRLLAGNTFFGSELSKTYFQMSSSGVVSIKGNETLQTQCEFKKLSSTLFKEFRKAGFLLIPGSFTRANIGADVHYVGTLPMSFTASDTKTNSLGCLSGYDRVHFVDGAVIPKLFAKPHTLTVMANADRIASEICSRA